jgi:8-oxo-dGTP pyrophosphatase MutT (NUDIX family)
MLQLVQSDLDPFARTSYEPGHFTASAFIVTPHDDILLVFHARLKKWLQPGGHIDAADPDVFAAARREVLEETGVVLDERAQGSLFDLDIHRIPARPNEPAHEHFDVRTLWRIPKQSVTAGSDALEVRWHALSEIDFENLDESLGRALRKLSRGQARPLSRR